MTPHPAPHSPGLAIWWDARSSLEKGLLALVGAIAGAALGLGLGIGAATALGGPPAVPTVSPEIPEAAPEAPTTTTIAAAPAPMVPPTTTTVAPAPEPTIPPTSTTIDPRPARRAEIADEVRVLNAAIDQRRSAINAHRVAEVEGCAAEDERLFAEYQQRQAATADARAEHIAAQRALQDHVLRHPPIGIGSDGWLADPRGRAAQDRLIAASDALEDAMRAEEEARVAGVANGEACAAQRASYGPIDDDPEIQDLMAQRAALIDEYDALG